MEDELYGVFNESADEVVRIDKTWSGTKLDMNYEGATYHEQPMTFDRLVCRNCQGIAFEVLATEDYQTTAKCLNCKMYYVVHSG